MDLGRSEYSADRYKRLLAEFVKAVKGMGLSTPERNLEFSFESMNDWNTLSTLDEIEKWYENKLEKEDMDVCEISLKDCRGWVVEEGRIYHESKEFFSIEGIRVKNTKNREVSSGWDQPIIKQAGWDGGILGLIRKRFNGVPHYLIEAKAEPGNPNMVQMSPSLQATFSNIKKVHHGREPKYLSFFQNPELHNAIVHYKQWLAEDGGRLYNKRNLNMLVELPESLSLNIDNENFIWMSMFQIKRCLLRDTWVNPHVRGIISHM